MNIIWQATKLERGDTVLLATRDTFSVEMVDVKRLLESKFPGVEFIIMSETDVIGVQKNSEFIDVTDDE